MRRQKLTRQEDSMADNESKTAGSGEKTVKMWRADKGTENVPVGKVDLYKASGWKLSSLRRKCPDPKK